MTDNAISATRFHGNGSQLTGISVDSTKIETGNTKVETIDTGSDGHIKVTTEGSRKTSHPIRWECDDWWKLCLN